MAENNDGNTLTIIGALAVGAIIGAGLALLMAPKPGAELREDIKSSAQTAAEKIHQVAEEFVDQVKAAGDQIAASAAEVTKIQPESEADTDTT
jgi:gas vesicle protein